MNGWTEASLCAAVNLFSLSDVLWDELVIDSSQLILNGWNVNNDNKTVPVFAKILDSSCHVMLYILRRFALCLGSTLMLIVCLLPERIYDVFPLKRTFNIYNCHI